MQTPRALPVAPAVGLIGLLLLAVGGCIPLVGQDPTGGDGACAPGEPCAGGNVVGAAQLERDPVPAWQKGGMGIEYNPLEMKANRFYQATDVLTAFSGMGGKGLTQHTFVGTGKVLQVALTADGQTMVYATTRYGKTPQICRQGAYSRAVGLLTEDRSSNMMPSISPRISMHDGLGPGNYVAWCSDRYGNWDILVQRLDANPDSQPRQITRRTDDDIHPTWSPDGKLLAFSRFNSMDGNWQIWIYNVATGGPTFVTEGLFPTFRPIVETGSRGQPRYTLAFQRHRRRDVPFYSVWTVAMEVGARGLVETVAAPQEIVGDARWAAITPAWSPNGEYLAFATVHKSRLTEWQGRIYAADDIYVVRRDGTDLTQVTRHPAADWYPTWSRDPNRPDSPEGRLFFTSNRDGKANVWSVRPVVAGMLAMNSTSGREMDAGMGTHGGAPGMTAPGMSAPGGAPSRSMPPPLPGMPGANEGDDRNAPGGTTQPTPPAAPRTSGTT